MLAWEDAGDLQGAAIVYCHGVPGSRRQRAVFMPDALLRRAGVRMITPDRPGCGKSTFQPDRTIDEWSEDIQAITSQLQLDRYAVLAFSGGTPYAITAAAADPAVSGLGIVSGDAPPGLVPDVVPAHPAMAERHPLVTSAILRTIRFAPRLFASIGRRRLTQADRASVDNPEIAKRFMATLRDALRHGTRGTLVDLQLAARCWEIRPPASAIPAFVWHGGADTHSPVSIARFLTDALPRATMTVFEDEGHLSAFVRHADAIVTALRDTVLQAFARRPRNARRPTGR